MRPFIFISKWAFEQPGENLSSCIGTLGTRQDVRYYVKSYMTFEIVAEGRSVAKFEIRLMGNVLPSEKGGSMRERVLYPWTFRISKSDPKATNTPVVYHYPAKYKPNAPFEAQYRQHNIIPNEDKHAQQVRKGGNLTYFELEFNPSLAETQSIFVDSPAIENEQIQIWHSHLQRIFSSDEVTTIQAFIMTRGLDVIAWQFVTFRSAGQMDRGIGSKSDLTNTAKTFLVEEEKDDKGSTEEYHNGEAASHESSDTNRTATETISPVQYPPSEHDDLKDTNELDLFYFNEDQHSAA